MSPMILTGAGWLLSALGFGGFLGSLGGPAAIAGYGTMAYGLQQIRWRNDWLGRAFWLAVAALVQLLLLVLGLAFDRAQVYTLTLTQAAIAFSVARGVTGCLMPSAAPTGKLRTLTVTGGVIAVATVILVLGDALVAAGAELPATAVVLLVFVSGLAGILFGGLLLTLNREAALQAED